MYSILPIVSFFKLFNQTLSTISNLLRYTLGQPK